MSKIVEFFDTHKALTVRNIAEEAGISERTLWSIVRYGKTPSKRIEAKLVKVLVKYGYSE